MKTLRIVALLLVSVMMVGVCTSCFGAILNRNKLVGTWKGELTTYTFRKDGTGTCSTLGIDVEFTYRSDKDELWMTSTVLGMTVNEVYTYKINKDMLKLTDSEGNVILLTRQ